MVKFNRVKKLDMGIGDSQLLNNILKTLDTSKMRTKEADVRVTEGWSNL
jgi:hypothetical protein